MAPSEPVPLSFLAERAADARRSASLRVSVVAPVFDEEDNLRELHRRVAAALGPADDDWELVLADDASRDGSAAVIRELAHADRRVRGVFLAANRGQSAALAAAVAVAVGERVATLDADLQNDPADLPAMLARLEGPAAPDAVVGVRARRRDSWVKLVSSRIANRVRNALTGDVVTDTGCAIRVVRADALRALPWFNGAHRFLPSLLRWHGFTVVEVDVGHHARTAGVSKYGVGNRAFRALRDALAMRWLRSRIALVPVDEVTPAGGTPDATGVAEVELPRPAPREEGAANP